MIASSVAKLKLFTGKRDLNNYKDKKKKIFFCGKFGSILMFRSMQKGKKCFCDEPTSI